MAVNAEAMADNIRSRLRIEVVVANLTSLSAAQQLGLVCRSNVLVGLTAPTLRLGRFLGLEHATSDSPSNVHSTDASQMTSAVVVEMRWRGQPCRYTAGHRAAGLMAACAMASPVRHAAMSARLVIPNVGSVLQELLRSSGMLQQALGARRRRGDAAAPIVQTSRRTLVVLLGSARGAEASWHSMRRHLLRPLQADLA